MGAGVRYGPHKYIFYTVDCAREFGPGDCGIEEALIRHLPRAKSIHCTTFEQDTKNVVRPYSTLWKPFVIFLAFILPVILHSR